MIFFLTTAQTTTNLFSTEHLVEDDQLEEKSHGYYNKIEHAETAGEIVFTDSAMKSLNGDGKSRKLKTVFTDPSNRSNLCKTGCIDKNFNFCLNSAGNGGFCCLANEQCPKFSYCSYDNQRAPAMFKYITCPNEPACGTKSIYMEYDSEEPFFRKIDKYNHNFVKNDVCSYIIHSPEQMQKNDQLKLQITKTENIDVYVAKGKGYRWFDHLDGLAFQGDNFDTRQGWQFYVVGVSNSVFPGYFEFKAWIEKGTAKYITL